MSRAGAIQTYSGTVSITSGQTVGTDNPATRNGYIVGIMIDAPDLTGATYTIAILGDTGFTQFSKASLTKAVKSWVGADANNVLLKIPMTSTTIVQITSASSEGSTRSIPYKLLIQGT